MLRHIISLLIIALVVGLGGCREKTQERKYRSVSGIAKHIDLASGEVAMDWTDHRTGEVQTFYGQMTDTTEILINGIVAELGDVHISDLVTVTAFPPKDEPNRWTVTSVSVERDADFVFSR